MQKEGKKDLATTATDIFNITKVPDAPEREAEDPFVGQWKAVWELVEHSDVTLDEIKADGIPTKIRFTFSVRKADDQYTVDGIPIVVDEVSVSGDTITIKGHVREDMKLRGYQERYDQEMITLILKSKNTVLEGTHRTVFAREFMQYAQESQIATIRAVR